LRVVPAGSFVPFAFGMGTIVQKRGRSIARDSKRNTPASMAVVGVVRLAGTRRFSGVVPTYRSVQNPRSRSLSRLAAAAQRPPFKRTWLPPLR
jgi:hypothetical protein